MRKNSGQALVEFIIIVPILLLILMGIVDFGNIIYQKYRLEGSLDTVVSLYQDNKQTVLAEYLLDQDLEVEYQSDGAFLTIIVKKGVDIITPGLNVALNDPYEIKVERTIYHE